MWSKFYRTYLLKFDIKHRDVCCNSRDIVFNKSKCYIILCMNTFIINCWWKLEHIWARLTRLAKIASLKRKRRDWVLTGSVLLTPNLVSCSWSRSSGLSSSFKLRRGCFPQSSSLTTSILCWSSQARGEAATCWNSWPIGWYGKAPAGSEKGGIDGHKWSLEEGNIKEAEVWSPKSAQWKPPVMTIDR